MKPTGMRMFRLDDISKRYEGRPALDRLSLDIPEDRTTVLIGPSGCGKSTLLRIMVGLVRPDTGTVTFDDQALDEASVDLVRRRLGYVIQQGGLFPHMTARENICLMARQYRWSPERIDDRLSELLTLTRFPADALDRYPGELSGGQNQRVALMRALMPDPRVLLLDEPLGALDPMIRFELQEDLQRVFSTLKKTVVMVTHDLAEAAFLGDLMVLMRAGRIVQRGCLTDLLQNPAEPFVEKFVCAQRSHLETGTVR